MFQPPRSRLSIRRPGRGRTRGVQPRSQAGFTLIELMAVAAIVLVLGLLAFPSFLESMRKGRRADAIAAMTHVQQAQERWRANNASYSDDLSGTPPAGLGINDTSSSGYYGLALSGVSATGYTVTATAVSGSTQATDTACQKIVLRWAGGNAFYSSADAGDVVDSSGTNRCWNR